MAVRDDSVQANLVQVWSLKPQHFIYTLSVDLIRSIAYFMRGAVGTPKSRLDELLAVFVQKVEGIKVGACRNFDKFCKAIPNLGSRQCTKESEVEKGVHGSMVCTKAILVIAIIDGNLDRHRGVYQTNDSGRHSDEIGVPAICGTSEPAVIKSG